MNFEVVQSDITTMSVSAIVLPANEKLKEGAGVSKAIFEKAGRKELTAACKELRSCKIGSAVPTLAFRLDANYIVHAVVPKWIDGQHQEYDYLSAAYLSALRLADILDCESIAFPLLAAGNSGFHLDLAYEIAKTSIETFEPSHLQKVYLVVYSDTATTFIKGKGVPVLNLNNPNPANQTQNLFIEFKHIAQDILTAQINKTLDYLKDEQNQEKIVEAGVFVAKMVFSTISKTSHLPIKFPRQLKSKFK